MDRRISQRRYQYSETQRKSAGSSGSETRSGSTGTYHSTSPGTSSGTKTQSRSYSSPSSSPSKSYSSPPIPHLHVQVAPAAADPVHRNVIRIFWRRCVKKQQRRKEITNLTRYTFKPMIKHLSILIPVMIGLIESHAQTARTRFAIHEYFPEGPRGIWDWVAPTARSGLILQPPA